MPPLGSNGGRHARTDRTDSSSSSCTVSRQGDGRCGRRGRQSRVTTGAKVVVCRATAGFRRPACIAPASSRCSPLSLSGCGSDRVTGIDAPEIPILENGGFEDGDALPYHWSRGGPGFGGSILSYDTGGAWEGERCVSISRATSSSQDLAYWAQTMRIEGFHGPLQAGVRGLVDHTHASAAELLDDLLVGDAPADQSLPRSAGSKGADARCLPPSLFSRGGARSGEKISGDRRRARG